MALETGTYIDDFVTTNPTGADDRSTADDHLRLIKTFILNTFPNITGAMNATHTQLNYVVGVTSAIQTQLDSKAPLAFRGALVYNTANITLTDTVDTKATFNSEVYDTDSIHSTSTNTERFTVPSGVTKVRLTFQYRTNATIATVSLFKNNSATYAGATKGSSTINAEETVVSPVYTVTGGDYFDFRVYQDTGSSKTLAGGQAELWFAMEIIE